MKKLGISEFKAKCIEALKTVRKTGEPLVVTLRKEPIVTINPYREEPAKRVLGKLRGRMAIHGNIVRDDFAEEWEMER